MFSRFLPKNKLTWLLLLVAVYAYVTYDRDYAPIKPPEPSALDAKVTATNSGVKFLESPGKAIIEKMQETKRGKAVVEAFMKSAIEDKYGSANIMSVAGSTADDVLAFDQIKGEGDVAMCNSQVTVNAEFFMENGVTFDSTYTHNKPITFTIGAGSVIPGLEQGVIGMHQGGKRKLVVPPKFAYDHTGFTNNFVPENKPISIELQMEAVKNTVKGMTILPQTTDLVPGIGNAVHCGQKVKITYKLGYQEKDKIISTEIRDLEFTTGKAAIPIGLDIGVLGMRPGGTRGIVLVPALQHVRSGTGAALIPESSSFPREPMITLEVKLLAVE